MSDGLALFLRTFAIGVAVAAPVGAMGVLCIRRTLSQGWRAGIATGLGVATADGFYAACAAFGLAAITEALVAWQTPLRLVGGAAMIFLGVRAWLTAHDCEPVRTARGTGMYLSAVGLTLTNPSTIVAFAAIFAGVGIVGAVDGWRAAALATAGVALGSLSWWLVLTSGLVWLRGRGGQGFMHWVNRLSGAVLVAFGAVAIGSVLL